jgi:hypothetical protein
MMTRFTLGKNLASLNGATTEVALKTRQHCEGSNIIRAATLSGQQHCQGGNIVREILGSILGSSIARAHFGSA